MNEVDEAAGPLTASTSERSLASIDDTGPVPAALPQRRISSGPRLHHVPGLSAIAPSAYSASSLGLRGSTVLPDNRMAPSEHRSEEEQRPASPLRHQRSHSSPLHSPSTFRQLTSAPAIDESGTCDAHANLREAPTVANAVALSGAASPSSGSTEREGEPELASLYDDNVDANLPSSSRSKARGLYENDYGNASPRLPSGQLWQQEPYYDLARVDHRHVSGSAILNTSRSNQSSSSRDHPLYARPHTSMANLRQPQDSSFNSNLKSQRSHRLSLAGASVATPSWRSPTAPALFSGSSHRGYAGSETSDSPVRSRSSMAASIGRRSRSLRAQTEPLRDAKRSVESEDEAIVQRHNLTNAIDRPISRANTIALRSPARPRPSSVVGSDQWWDGIDDLRSQLHERPPSRLLNQGDPPSPARQRPMLDRERTLRPVHSSSGTSFEPNQSRNALSAFTPSRSMTALGHRQAEDLRRTPSRQPSLLQSETPHQELLLRAFDGLSRHLATNASSDASEVALHLGTLVEVSLSLNAALRDLAAQGLNARIEAELDDVGSDPLLGLEQSINPVVRTSDEQLRGLTDALISLSRHERQRSLGSSGSSPRERLRERASRYDDPSDQRAARMLSPLSSTSQELPALPPRADVAHLSRPALLAEKTVTPEGLTLSRSPTSRLSRRPREATISIDATDAFAAEDSHHGGRRSSAAKEALMAVESRA